MTRVLRYPFLSAVSCLSALACAIARDICVGEGLAGWARVLLVMTFVLLVLCFMLRWSNMRKDARRQELLKKKAEYEATQQSAEDTPAEAVSAEDMTVDGAPVPAEAPAETTEKESDI